MTHSWPSGVEPPVLGGEELELLRQEPPRTDGSTVSRVCAKCGFEKPIDQFEYRTKQGRRRKTCKLCRAPAKRLSRRKWSESNKEHIAVYNKEFIAKRRLEILSQRPPRVCPCGQNDPSRFIWRTGIWVCLDCSAKRSVVKERARERLKNIKLRSLFLAKTEGQKVSTAYDRYMARHPKSKSRVSLVNLLRVIFPKFGTTKIWRIYDLNRISNLPLYNIGWSCRLCKTYSEHPSFFEIDHCTPRHKEGSGRISNLEILCPNCHKRKTLHDVLGDQSQFDELSQFNFLPPSPGEKPGEDDSVAPVQCMPLPPRGNTLAECQPANDGREALNTAALEEITSPHSDQPRSSLQAYSPSSTSPQPSAAPTETKTESQTYRPN